MSKAMASQLACKFLRLALFCSVWCATSFSFAVSAQSAQSTNSGAAKKHLRILATTYPVFIFTQAIVKGDESTSLDLLLPANLGCPHDYSLTPQDVGKLAQADLLVANGMGMEEFLGAPIEKARPNLPVVDASNGLKEKLQYTDSEKAESEHGHSSSESARFNPHYFASPRSAANAVIYIAKQLSELHPAGQAIYTENAAKISSRLNELANSFANFSSTLQNPRVVTQHADFDYFARDAGIKIVATIQAHSGEEPSAAQMMRLVKEIKRNGVRAIFVEPQFSQKIAETIAREANIPIAKLDPIMTGPKREGFDYYEAGMRKNLQTLEKILGQK